MGPTPDPGHRTNQWINPSFTIGSTIKSCQKQNRTHYTVGGTVGSTRVLKRPYLWVYKPYFLCLLLNEIFYCISPDKSLESQFVKNNAQVMVIFLSESEVEARRRQNDEEQAASSLSRMRRAAEVLARRTDGECLIKTCYSLLLHRIGFLYFIH